jgi:undecaprenyl pyrophosphate synthase
MFISEDDGRESLVDLTKTLCDMAQRGKLTSDDVSVELVDAEVKGRNLICHLAVVPHSNRGFLQKIPWTSRIC